MRLPQRYRVTLALGFAIAAAMLGGARGYAAQVVDAASVQKAAGATAAHAARFKALADRGAVDELVSAIRALPDVAPQGSIAHEQLLNRGLHELGRLEPTPAAQALVRESARLQPQVYVRVDPDHGAHATPLYDPGATARFVLGKWTRTEARNTALAALTAGERWPIERFARQESSADADAAQGGVVDAFQALAPRTLATLRDTLATSLRRGERVDELAAVAAERLQDAELFALVFAHADAAVALKAISKASQTLEPADQFEALRTAAQRAELASAATLQIGRLAGDEARARAHLFEQLTDPGVADSAAAALASLHDAAVASELGRRLRSESREAVRRRLALALQLDGSQTARAELERFVEARSGSTQLRKDVSAWLAH